MDDISQVPVKGHTIDVIYGARECSVSGELIAVTRDSVLVFDESGQLRSVPQSSLVEIDLLLHPSSSGSIYTTTTIGSFSTVSHGLWLVISLPLWLGIGLPLASSESRASHLQVDANSAPRLAAYARFPQGALMDWSHRTSPVPNCSE